MGIYKSVSKEMKVGNLNYTNLGCYNIVCGANSCSMSVVWIIMYFFFGGAEIGVSMAIEFSAFYKVFLWTLIGFNTLLYLYLCTSGPGIPEVIMNKCKAMHSGKVSAGGA